nr:MAG TPA: holliday junction resolvase [Caudoviricetes sp.]
MSKNRRKADGTEFEREFKETVEPRYYIKRLPTLNTGFAGLRQPADFILVGRCFNYIECKETTGDRFAISTMEQFDKMCEFLEDKKRYPEVEMNYYIIVHYLVKGVYKVVLAEDAKELADKHKTLKFDADVGLTFSRLEDLGGIAF